MFIWNFREDWSKTSIFLHMSQQAVCLRNHGASESHFCCHYCPVLAVTWPLESQRQQKMLKKHDRGNVLLFKPTFKSLARGTVDSPDAWAGACDDSVSFQKLFQWKSFFTGDILNCPSGQSQDPDVVLWVTAVGEAWLSPRVQTARDPGHSHISGPGPKCAWLFFSQLY